MVPACDDAGEAATCGDAGGRISLAAAVAAPANDGPVGSEGARMDAARGDGGVLAVGRVTLAIAVVAPAGDSAIGSEGA